jgi:hypothetical protein
MISLELSTIQSNSAAQARIDAARADFLARGGRIQVLDKTQTVDAPVSKDRAYVGRLSLLECPRHEITVSPDVARKLELAYQRERLRLIEK